MNAPTQEQKNRFARNLKQIMSKKNVSLSQLAKALEIRFTNVYPWIGGKVAPNVATLEALADLFCVTMDELWRGGGGSEAQEVAQDT